VLSPVRTPPGKTARAELYDAEENSGKLLDWFQARIRGAGEDARGCRPELAKDHVTCVVSNRGHDDYYYGFPLKDGRYRFVRFVMGPNTLAAAAYILDFGQILKSAQAGLGRSGATGPQAAPVRSEPASSSVQPVTPNVASTTPDGSYQIPMDGLYLHLTYGLGGVGGSMTMNYKPHVLLRDGTITDDLDFYPHSEAEMRQWRARKPRAWGGWRRSGSGISIRWNDPGRKPEQWDKWFIARPGAEGMTLAGLFRAMGGGGNSALGGDVTIAAWSQFQFSSDGAVITGGGSGSFVGGSQTTVATSAKRRQEEARYSIRGHSLQLTYADGGTETRWFYRYPDSDRLIGVGAGTYVKRK
jgi:hypothetical protein